MQVIYLSALMIFIVSLSACTGQTDATKSGSQPEFRDPVVARINDTEFTQSQLEHELAIDRAVHWLTTGQELLRQDPEEKLERLTTALLIDQEARDAGISASEDEVAKTLTVFVEERNVSVEMLENALRAQGLTLDEFTETVVARTVRTEKYITDVVMAGVETPAEQQENLAAWLADIQKNTTVEILYEPPEEAPVLNAVAPDFTLTNLAGEAVSLSQFRGKPVVINFWATWCVPCRREMPAFQQAFETYQADDLVILAINMEEDATLVEPFVDELGLDFEILYDEDGQVTKEYQVTGLPRTLFVDPQGVIRHIQVGEVQDVLLDGFLNRILPE